MIHLCHGGLPAPNRGHHLPRLWVTVAHHQAPAPIVALLRQACWLHELEGAANPHGRSWRLSSRG